MQNLSNWSYYYNLEGAKQVRANLVYTPLVSPDGKTFCMSFNRDQAYHRYPEENTQWTTELLEDRFRKELKFHQLASTSMPTLKIIDVDEANRQLFIEWHGDDFYMQGLKNNGYDNVLPNWKEQWCSLIKQMWKLDIYKISLHPNSWVVHNGTLYPFNWFFCYSKDDPMITVRSLLMQISVSRQEKLGDVELDKPYTPQQAQLIAFNSFRNNYPTELIDSILTNYKI